jgi:hypothetical protein
MPVPYAPRGTFEPNTSIADLILRAGQQRAQIQQQMFGQLANTVGQLGEIPGQIQRQKLEAARTQREEQMAASQAAQMKRQQEDQAALDKGLAHYGEPGFDREQILSGLEGHLRPQISKILDEADASAAKSRESRTEYRARLAAGVNKAINLGIDPLKASAFAIQHAVVNGDIRKDEAEQILGQIQSDPNAVKPLMETLIAQSPTVAKELREEEKPLLKGPEQSLVSPTGKVLIPGEAKRETRSIDVQLSDPNITPERRAALLKAKRDEAIAGHVTEPKLYQVDTVDAEGNPIKTFVSEADARKMAAGGAGIKKPPSTAVQNREVAAKSSIVAGESLLKQLSDPKVTAQLGPIIGRYNSLAAAAGAGDPTAQELVGAIKSFSALQPQIHGFRAFQMGQDIERLLSTKQTPEALAAALRGVLTASYIVSGRGPGGEKEVKVQSIVKDPNQ